MKQLFLTVWLLAVLAGARGQGFSLDWRMLFTEPQVIGPEKMSGLKERLLELQKKGMSVGLFTADRGNGKGMSMVVVAGSMRTMDATPLEVLGLSKYLNSPDDYTTYEQVAHEQKAALGKAEILGIHYIKVKSSESQAFDNLVKDKLHPTLNKLLPDLRMWYYRATSGRHTGSNILIFSIETYHARDVYWPKGKDAQVLKDAFQPAKELASELIPLQEPGSYLELSSGAAAAGFEAKIWTDFVYQPLH